MITELRNVLRIDVDDDDQDDVRSDLARELALFQHRYHRWSQAFCVKERPGGDLNQLQLWVLFLIRDRAIAPGELARELRVTPTVITGIVDRLERRRLLIRVDDPADRRRVHLKITRQGRDLSLAADEATHAFIAARMDAFSDDEIGKLAEATSMLRDLLDRLEDAGDAAHRGPSLASIQPNFQ